MANADNASAHAYRSDEWRWLQPEIDRSLRTGQATWGESWSPDRIAVAPGRIEVLGNHLDYNGGNVLAAAIDRAVVVASGDGASRGTVAVRFADQPNIQEHPDQTFSIEELRNWSQTLPPSSPGDYVRGLISAALANGMTIRDGAELSVAGNVPIGFGLSSSAALCVALSLAIIDPPPSGTELVLLAQAAEHRSGTPCGTMDQSASVAGGLILFDAATLSVEHTTPDLGDYRFIVADSGVDRSLGASSYPIRVRETAEALAIARSKIDPDLPSLAALHADQAQALLASGSLSPELIKRVLHVVSESERVSLGVAALRRVDLPVVGELMSASGASSATVYDVSHPVVEELVMELRRQDGVLGARMMGGGGGGSVLALAHVDAISVIDRSLRASFYARHGMTHREFLVHACRFAPAATLL